MNHRPRKFVVVIHDVENWAGELYRTQNNGGIRHQFTGHAEFVKATAALWDSPRNRTSPPARPFVDAQ